MYLPRGLEQRLLSQLESRPVIILEGARGVGKTRLANQLVEAGALPGRFFSFADEATRASAETSPKAFVDELPFGSVVDEAQLVPEIQLQLKQLVDADSAPGRALLTGSSRIAKDQLGGSAPLAGRSSTLQLHPFTQSERAGDPVSVLGALFEGDPTRLPFAEATQAEILRESIGGGFPLLSTKSDRSNFIEDALPESEVAGRNRAAVLATGRQLAALTAKPYVADQVTRDMGLDKRTVGEYVDLWERLMLIRRLPNWRPSHSSSARAQRKLHVVDIGLATAWGHLDEDRDRGPLLETMVVNELIGQSWSDPDILFFHYREDSTHEVDLVLSHPGADELVGIEVKAASEVEQRDFKQLLRFRERSKGRMSHGYVFYSGNAILPFGDSLWAIPMTALWGGANQKPSGQESLSEAASAMSAALRSHGNPSLLANRSAAVAVRVSGAMEHFTETISNEISGVGLTMTCHRGRLAAPLPKVLPHASAASARVTGATTTALVLLVLEAAPVGGDNVEYSIWLGQRTSSGSRWSATKHANVKIADAALSEDVLLAALAEFTPQLTELLSNL